MDFKQRILEAAAKVYAECGYRGATTRRIAAEARCNELTLFRHFGSKATLIHEAVTCSGSALERFPLPEDPIDPAVEVREWAGKHFENIRTHAAMIRTTLGEIEEHPELVSPSDPYAQAYQQLSGYVAKLQAAGLADRAIDPTAAAAMLLNTLMLNGMMRDVMPHLISNPPEHDLDHFVRVFLRGIGAVAPVQA